VALGVNVSGPGSAALTFLPVERRRGEVRSRFRWERRFEGDGQGAEHCAKD
jgi:hypothetical protein